jgi:hypothetical protein
VNIIGVGLPAAVSWPQRSTLLGLSGSRLRQQGWTAPRD